MLQRTNVKESEGSGPCWSLKEGKIDDLNVCASKANSGYDAKDPMHRCVASGSKDCRSMFLYMAFRACGSTPLETRARDGRSRRGRNWVTFSHISEGMLASEGMENIDRESD